MGRVIGEEENITIFSSIWEERTSEMTSNQPQDC